MSTYHEDRESRLLNSVFDYPPEELISAEDPHSPIYADVQALLRIHRVEPISDEVKDAVISHAQKHGDEVGDQIKLWNDLVNSDKVTAQVFSDASLSSLSNWIALSQPSGSLAEHKLRLATLALHFQVLATGEVLNGTQ
ncbi:hypothetical protein C4579_04185 [Candidatus Microgenomates bacterium]|nr:MAG: hypothetical protein C4579_04185 [Candidatus Microgenomates bacterium]